MKKIIISMMFVSASLFITNNAKAQFNLSISIGNPPAWAPQGSANAQYYYMPDMDIYYDVPAKQFVYQSNNRWMRSSALPYAYRRYDLYQVHKVALNQRNAYLNHDRDKRQYAQFKGTYDQQPGRDNRTGNYTSRKNNGQYNRFNEDAVKKNREVAKHDGRKDDRNDGYRDNNRR